jgi:hypothetical protein
LARQFHALVTLYLFTDRGAVARGSEAVRRL